MSAKKVDEEEKLKELVLRNAKEGRVIVMMYEGPVAVDLEEIIKQPTEGLLYDLNRDKATILTFIDDPKWINDFAVALVIEKLKEKNKQLRTTLDKARKVIQAYSDYLEGEYEEIPEQKGGNAWLEANPVKKSREEELADEWREEHPKEIL